MADRHPNYEPAHRSVMPDPESRFEQDGELHEVPTSILLKDMVYEAQTLLKEEVRLAKLEARAEVKKAVKAGTGFGAGAVLLHTGVLAFAAFLIAVGDTFLPLWLSAGIVCVLFLAAGAVAALYGKKKAQELEPARPVSGFKEEKEWLSDTMRSARSSRHGHA